MGGSKGISGATGSPHRHTEQASTPLSVWIELNIKNEKKKEKEKEKKTIVGKDLRSSEIFSFPFQVYLLSRPPFFVTAALATSPLDRKNFLPGLNCSLSPFF